MLAQCIVREARILRGVRLELHGVSGGSIMHCLTPADLIRATSAWLQGRRLATHSSRQRRQKAAVWILQGSKRVTVRGLRTHQSQ